MTYSISQADARRYREERDLLRAEVVRLRARLAEHDGGHLITREEVLDLLRDFGLIAVGLPQPVTLRGAVPLWDRAAVVEYARAGR